MLLSHQAGIFTVVRAIEGWRCLPASRRESRDVGVPNTAEYLSACCAVCRPTVDRLPIAPRLEGSCIRLNFQARAPAGARMLLRLEICLLTMLYIGIFAPLFSSERPENLSLAVRATGGLFQAAVPWNVVR
jgi:hypothetical protein